MNLEFGTPKMVIMTIEWCLILSIFCLDKKHGIEVCNIYLNILNAVWFCLYVGILQVQIVFYYVTICSYENDEPREWKDAERLTIFIYWFNLKQMFLDYICWVPNMFIIIYKFILLILYISSIHIISVFRFDQA